MFIRMGPGGLSDRELTELKRRQAQLIKDGAGIRPATKSKNSAAFAEKLGQQILAAFRW